jgi:hypothetical protein
VPPFPPPPPTITGRAAPRPSAGVVEFAPPTGFAPPADPVAQLTYQPAQGHSREYSQWARNQPPHGNLYGGAPAQHYQAPEHTDSLTGHILSQGRPDTGGSNNTTRVIMIMLIMLAVVVIGTVIAIS